MYNKYNILISFKQAVSKEYFDDLTQICTLVYLQKSKVDFFIDSSRKECQYEKNIVRS